MLSFTEVSECVQKSLASLAPGYLSKWLLFISVVSIFNSVQTYINIDLTRRVYENKPNETTSLSARTFGTWTLVSCIIRLYGALYLTENHVYQLTFISYVIALLHFGSELLIFRTCKLGAGFLGPLVVSTTSLVWMYFQKEFYTGVPFPF
ncbi:Erg28 [Kluyveromyces lactis]|nr:Erg28 [Kluyveromyces lactis]